MQQPPRSEIDPKGWLLIARCTLGVAVCVIPVTILSLGVFMKPLGDAMGWGRGDISFALTLLSVTMAAAMPIAGRLIDQFGIRVPLLASLLLYGGGIALLPTVISAAGISGFYLMFAWLGIAGSASSSVAYVKLLSAWFDKSRGLALGCAMSGVALGGAVTPLIGAVLIQHFGWQGGFYGLAALPLLLGIPVALSLQVLSSTNRAAAAAPREDLPGLTTSEAARTRAFWTLFLLFLVVATAIHGIQIHLAPLLSDRGLTPEGAALGVTFMFTISVAMRLLCGYLFDRLFAPFIGAACFLAATIGAAMLVPEAQPVIYLSAVALLGVGAGAESDLMAYLVSRYFGLKSFAAIYGWLFGAFMAGSALGPFLLGLSYDSTGSYRLAMIWCAVGLGLGTALLVALPRFPVWGTKPESQAVSPELAAEGA